MPANLPPEYFEAEKRFRDATSSQEKIACLEELISTVPKHKGTDKLRADLRRRLSKLKSTSEAKRGGSRQASVYTIDKEGAGQVVLVGPANVGKSALLTALTNATPEIAEFPFATWGPTPGMMSMEDIQIQLIDTPPLSREFVEPEMLNLVRRADLVLLILDLSADPIEQMEESIAMLQEYRIAPASSTGNRTHDPKVTFIPLVVAVNKVDDEASDADYEVLRELLGDRFSLVPASATMGRHLDRLRRAVFEQLHIVRVYAKPPGKEPDMDTPFVLKEGSTVAEFAAKVHRDFVTQLKTARIWGSGLRDGQMVGRDHVLEDRDVVELRI
jgi:hypothetical protein